MDFLSGNVVEIVLMVLVLFNVLATAVVKVLDVIKKPLAESHWLYKAISLVQKAIDAVSANRQHSKK
jgi:hypothetical protein